MFCTRLTAGALLLCLLLAVSGCSQPATPPAATPPAEPQPVQTEPQPTTTGPAAPRSVTPRLLLDLDLGDEPDQPGRLPSRVGGVSQRGPVAIAVASTSTIYLLDQGKGRVLRYEEGKVTGRIYTPWVADQGGALRLEPDRLVLTSHFKEYTLDLSGRVLDLRLLPYQNDPFIDSKEPVLLGEDPEGNRYERLAASPGPLIRRMSPVGVELDRAPDPGHVVDWYISRDGGLYTLSWKWGVNQIERAYVHEVLPPLTNRTAVESVPPPQPPEPPTLLGRPVPDRLRLYWPNGAPVEVGDPIDRWNLWHLLATAEPATVPLPDGMQPLTRLEAAFADGSTLSLDLYPDQVAVEGSRYRIRLADELRLALGASRVEPEALTAAVTGAQQVSVAIIDLPGVERSLTAQERQRLVDRLKGALPVHMNATPQPLEPTFPRYAIRLKGDGWEGELVLKGERHLTLGYGAAAAHDGAITQMLTGWLPLPELKRDQVSYLFLADKLQIGEGPGNDLTRWKATVVRRLLNARVVDDPKRTVPEPFTLIFHVRGERLKVRVETEGFTYGGRRYPGSGLTDIQMLQGVP